MIKTIKDMFKYVMRPPKDKEEESQYLIMALIFLGGAILCFFVGVVRMFSMGMV